MDPITAALVILSVLTALLFAAGAGLYRRVRELELAVHTGVGLGVPIGDGPVPALGAPGRTTIVVKVNRRCPVCEEVLDAVARLAPTLPGDAGFTVLADGPGVAVALPEGVRVVEDPDVWRSVTVPYVPALLVVDERGTVVHTAPAGSARAVAETAERFAAQHAKARYEEAGHGVGAGHGAGEVRR